MAAPSPFTRNIFKPSNFITTLSKCLPRSMVITVYFNTFMHYLRFHHQPFLFESPILNFMASEDLNLRCLTPSSPKYYISFLLSILYFITVSTFLLTTTLSHFFRASYSIPHKVSYPKYNSYLFTLPPFSFTFVTISLIQYHYTFHLPLRFFPRLTDYCLLNEPDSYISVLNSCF